MFIEYHVLYYYWQFIIKIQHRDNQMEELQEADEGIGINIS